MTSEQWQRIDQVFHAALDRDAAQRSEYLIEACAGDEQLHTQVAALLISHLEEDRFIQDTVFTEAARVLIEDDSPSMIGQNVGLYRIAREIGRGGMGTVYLGLREDDQFQQQVAIKIVRRGMDTDLVLARFRNERQILADFDHPHIARLFDGGSTATGLPYFVMEYIEGESIDAFCDRRRLTTAERLELFRKVCAAVQYAHQHLVVHRDIKPSNILVTTDGMPKLLDFGIAKMLDPETAPGSKTTALAQRLMTPEYASPEQVRGERVTTVSDVYSLGVLLYELLSGHSPYRFKTLSAENIARIVSENDPERPSAVIDRKEEVASAEFGTTMITPESVSRTREGRAEKLRRKLTGDLDNIVLMAMRKEPARRYASVGQFAEDIRRHLVGLPVLARKSTFAYRSAKFIRRNRVVVTAAALVFVTLLIGLAATGWEAHAARVERARAEAASARAERRFNEVRKLAHSVLFDYSEAIQDLPGSLPVRERLVKDALEYLDSLAGEANNDPSLQRELATAYEKVGDVQGRTLRANLGDTAGAKDSYRKALKIREALVAADPNDPGSRSDLADSYREFGRLLWTADDTAGGLEIARKEILMREALVSADPANPDARFKLGANYADVGEMLFEQGHEADAEENLGRAMTLFAALAAADPANDKYRAAIPFIYQKTSEVKLWQGDSTGALTTIRQAIALDTKLSTEFPVNTHYRQELGVDLEKEGNARDELGDIKGALESYRNELQIFAAQAVADPANAQFRGDLSSAYLKVGNMLAKTGQPADALLFESRALAIRKELATSDPMDLWRRWDLIESQAKTANALARQHNTSDALDGCRKAQALLADIVDDPTNAFLRTYRAYASADIAEALTLVADSRGTASADRKGLRLTAAALDRQSIEIWDEMRKNRTLSSPDAARSARLAHEIAESTHHD